MTASETLRAFESNLITKAEAIEQAMCECIDDVYERAASESRRERPPSPLRAATWSPAILPPRKMWS